MAERADGDIRLEVDPATWIELSPLDTQSVVGVIEDGALVFRDRAPFVDQAWSWMQGGVEETRRIRAGGSARESMRVRKGPSVGSIEVVDQRVVVRDVRGRIRFASSEVTAIDARGVSRRGTASLDGDRLTFDVDLQGLTYPIDIDPAWTAAGTFADVQTLPCVASLPSGKVYAFGGFKAGPTGAVPLATAEVWSPSTMTWSLLHPMSVGRLSASCAALDSGKLLVTGGGDFSSNTSSSEIYDPATDTWTTAAPMSVPRFNFTLVKLPSGKVLAASGDPGRKAAADVYDPTTDTWSPTGAMAYGRTLYGAAMLPSGKALVAGGTDAFSGFEQSTAETYDPSTNNWTTVAPLTVQRSQPPFVTSMIALGGKALFAGGMQPYAKATVDIYDPIANSWTRAPLGVADQPSLAPLPGNRALVIGDTVTTSIFDLATRTSQSGGNTSVRRTNPGFGAEPDGSVLVVGGWGSQSSELFALQPNGSACTLAGTCASGLCVDGVCCDRACNGTCQACDVSGSSGTCTTVVGAPHGTRSCAPFAVCAAGACITSCTADSDCVGDHYCASGACVPKKDNGLGCSGAGNCTSGNCVDGVCCDTACSGQCEACDVTGKFGTCSPVVGDPRAAKPACTGTAPGTPCGIQCTGASRTSCGYPDATVTCGAAACDGSVERRPSVCDGAGACKDTSRSCGAYACGATACKIACTGDGDCSAGSYCSSNVCVALDGLGATCTVASACSTGNCVDGACCATSSCPSGATCAGATKGRCSKNDGITCSIGAECGSGQCVDGVCCNSVCDGQCEACDVPGSIGTCSAVSGVPHGPRAACDDGGAERCAARTCDGATDRKSCAGFLRGSETVCRAARCTASGFEASASCDGKGSCAVPKPSSCVPYSCDAKGCLTSCGKDADCAEGFACASGACTPIPVTCSNDGLESVPRIGVAQSCAPYRCDASSGKCRASCSDSSQCVPDANCDTTTGTCIEGNGHAAGGCTTSGRAGGEGASIVFLVAATWLGRRRARALRSIALATLALTGCSAKARVTESTPHRTLLDEASALGIDVPRAAGGQLRIELPTRIDAPARVLDDRGGILEIASDLPPRDVDERSPLHVAAHQVEPFVDAMWASDGEHLEELRIVRRAIGTYRATYTIRLGGDLQSLTLRHGRIEAGDAQGRVRLQSGLVFAKDSAGTVRDASVRLTHELGSYRMVVEMPLDGLRAPIVVDPAWSRPAVLMTPRRDFTATELPGGKVLLVGGDLGSTIYSEVDLFDPATGLIAPSTSLPAPRAQHNAILLKNGKVLVAGGGTTSDAQIYDPATAKWTLAGYPTARGYGMPLVVLADTRLFMANNTSTIYDQSSGLWSSAATMLTPRLAHAAATMASGKVLVAGGFDASTGMPISTAEIYNPSTDTWTATGSLTTTRTFGSAALLSDGRIIVGGGGTPAPSGDATSEIYDPTSGTWSTVTMSTTRTSSNVQLANLPNGRILFAGRPVATEVFDPIASKWIYSGDMTEARDQYAMARLTSGAVLYAGGVDGGAAPTGIEIFKLIADGGSCAIDGECFSGNCVNNICCHTACGGTCSACDVAGSVGTCVALTGDPHYGRTCSGYACGAGACKTSCTVDSDCVTGSACFSGACKPKLTNGASCTRAAECASSQCVDAVCCESACTANCAACDVAGHLGRCWPVEGAPHAARPVCSGAGLGTACGPSCDGKDATKCNFATTSTPCGAATCDLGIETHDSLCDGKGACADVPKSCGVYACGATACKVTCAADIDCVAGYYCKTGTCSPIEGLGATCGTDGTCKTGHCVHGACCAVVACAADETCASGTCKKLPGAACVTGDQCATSVCADGVCCDRACGGQCEACDAPATKGTCSPIKGAPHAGRAACTGGTGTCDAPACDGITASACAGYVADASATCAPATCTNSRFVAAAHCDGKGACAASAGVACAPYDCDLGGCLDSCSTDAQCASGFSCHAGKCLGPAPSCTSDGTASVAVDGTKTQCDPYRCGASGQCLTACATSADCAIGDRCDVVAKTCAAAPGANRGGCNASTRSASVAHAWGLAVLSLAAIRRRRRR